MYQYLPKMKKRQRQVVLFSVLIWAEVFIKIKVKANHLTMPFHRIFHIVAE